MTVLRLLPAVLLLAGVTACGGATPARSEPAYTAAGGGTAISTITSRYGLVLADGAGRALYARDASAHDSAACDTTCAQQWPPFAAQGVPQAADATLTALTTAQIGTVAGGDGQVVSYFGRPLHHFGGDTTPGATGGEAVTAFGGTWYLVAPSGGLVKP